MIVTASSLLHPQFGVPNETSKMCVRRGAAIA